MGPGCVKSRALAKCREHHSSKLHLRMQEEHAAPAPDDSCEKLSAPSASVRLFTQPGSIRKCPGSRGTSVLPSGPDSVSLPRHVRLVQHRTFEMKGPPWWQP